MNPKLNCLSYWFPRIKDVVPVPKTTIIRTGIDLIPLLDGKPVEGFEELVEEVSLACDAVGYPAFLRTGQTSGKHDWRDTCFIKDRSVVGQHMLNLVEYSEMCSLIGLPYDVWVVREMLPTKPIDVAFDGMPVCREFRVFVNDADIVCLHPYWGSFKPAWMASVIQGPVQVEDFLSSFHGLGGYSSCWRDVLVSPSVFTDVGSGKNIRSMSDFFANANKSFCLPLLDPKKWDEKATYIGGFVASDIPVIQRFSSGNAGLDQLRLNASESGMEKIDGSAFNLLDLDHRDKGDGARCFLGLSNVDGKTTISIKNSGQICKGDRVFFHRMNDTSTDTNKQEVFVTVIPKSECEEAFKKGVPERYNELCQFKSMDEEQFVRMFASMAGRAAGGSWSVDLLDTERGWFATDMAVAADSWHWPGCSREGFGSA